MSQPQSYFNEDSITKELSFRRLFLKIWPYLWAYKAHVVGIVIIVLLFVLVGRLLPFLFGQVIDEVIGQQRIHLLYYIAAAYLILEVLRSAFAFAQSYFMQKLGNKALYEIREQQINHVQKLPIPYFDKNPTGRTVTRVTNDISSLGELFSQGFTAIFVNSLEIVSILIALSFISIKLTLATICLAPVLIWISLFISRKIRYYFKEAKRKLATINAYTAENIGGMKVLQLFDRTQESRSYFKNISQDYRSLQLKTVGLFALLWPILEGFNVVTVATALFFGAMFLNSLGLSIGELTAFILLLQGFFRPLRIILERYNQLQNSLASADRVFQILEETPEPTNGQQLPPTAKLQGHIQIKNLSFQYSPDGPYVLKNINLEILPGENIALVGRTGSGKTTLISLLQQLYPYQKGEILVDGYELKRLSPESLRPRIGVVQQDNFIFKGTIESNISLNNPNISQSQVEWAAQLAHCHNLLKTHRGGLQAKVEERGANLSVGERQLIAFARVLAFDPDILILDEATANIDSVNEQHIQKATETVTQGRTSLVIAHRLSTILNCDRIVLMDQGQILEIGSHNQLMALQGRYAELFKAQFKSTKPLTILEQPLAPVPEGS